jgi:hypothetical protein
MQLNHVMSLKCDRNLAVRFFPLYQHILGNIPFTIPLFNESISPSGDRLKFLQVRVRMPLR